MRSSLLRPPRLFLQRVDSVQGPERGSGRRYWVVSRALCRFRELPVPEGAGAGKGRAALELRIKSWSPFPDTGFVLHAAPSVPGGRADRVAAWIWDRRRVQEAMSTAGAPAGLPVLPETLLHPPGENGVRLIAVIDGVEGQYWRDGRLRESRWWPRPPSLDEWIAFQRGAGIPPDEQHHALPTAARLEWTRRPWLNEMKADGGLGARADRLLSGAAVAVAMLFLFFAAEHANVRLTVAATQREIADLMEQGEPSLAAHAASSAALRDIGLLQSLDAYPPTLQQLATFGERLHGRGMRVADWHFQAGRLQVLLEAPHGADTAALVRVLQETPIFSDISVERLDAGDGLRVRLQVRHASP